MLPLTGSVRKGRSSGAGSRMPESLDEHACPARFGHIERLVKLLLVHEHVDVELIKTNEPREERNPVVRERQFGLIRLDHANRRLELFGGFRRISQRLIEPPE